MQPLEIYLSELDRTALLTADEEVDLARRVRAGDMAARDQMVRANLSLVVHIARDRGRCNPRHFEDSIAEGNLGLLRAVELFDPERGYRFSTYAAYWIEQYIKRYVKNNTTIRVPLYVYGLQGDEARGERIRARERRVVRAAELALTCSAESQVLLYGRINEEEATLASVVADDSAADAGAEIERAELLERLRGAVDALDARSRFVIVKRFGLDGQPPQDLKAVGNALGLARERVRQIERQALQTLCGSPELEAAV